MSDMQNAFKPDPPNQQNRPAPGMNYQFSTDEMRVLRECNKESFYQRSLPLGTFMGLCTFYAVKAGKLRPSPRFGPFPKVMGAIIAGYFMGKMSYQTKCAEKLMELPGSYIGEMLRQKKFNDSTNTTFPSAAPNGPAMFGATAPEVYSDAPVGQSSSLDLDTDRPTFAGLEDTYKPSEMLSDSIPKTPGMSYDDLRKKNREEHAAAKTQPYKMEEPMPPIVRARPELPAKNKYGDIITD